MTVPVIPASAMGVFGVRDPLLGTTVITGLTRLSCLIGKTFGAVTTISNEPVARMASGTTLLDLLIHNNVTRIASVSNTSGGSANYTKDTDYRLNGSSIEWLGTLIPTPSGLAGSDLVSVPTSTRTGLLPDTYLYVVAAIIKTVDDGTTLTYGETLPTNAVSVVVGGGNPITNSVRLTWSPVTNAIGYRVYRKLEDTADYTDSLIAEVAGGASNTLLDDGYTEVTGTPVTVSTAFNRPADGVLYYATYIATIFNYNTPQTFYSLTDLINAHSLGSDLAIAGAITLGRTGVGQGASKVMTVAVQSMTTDNVIAALASIEKLPVDYITGLTGDYACQQLIAQHIVNQSYPTVGRPRKGFFGYPRTMAIGDANSVGTVVYNAQALNIDDEIGNPNGYRMVCVGETYGTYGVQLSDGSRMSTVLDGWFLAAAVAGRAAANPDPATPLTEKQLVGFKDVQVYGDGQTSFLEESGLLTLEEEVEGTVTIYHGRTLDTTTVENAEFSVVDADDEVDMRLRKAFKSGYRGQKITADFIKAVGRMTREVLGGLVKETIIAGYNLESIEVSADPDIPTRVNITFVYTAIYPCNSLVFRRGYDLGDSQAA